MLRPLLALAVLLGASTLEAQTVMPLPPFASTFTGALTRGYWFQCPANIIITGLQVPDESGHGLQNVEVFRLPGQPPQWPALGSGVQVFYQTGVPSNQVIPCSILVNSGEYIGILGACGDSTTMRNSYSSGGGPFPSTILGLPVTLDRFLTQSNIVASGGNQQYSWEPNFAIGRVEMTYTAQSGLYASFSATPTTGPTPLNVNFTDTSFSSDPGGVTSWAWDLDGDGIVDSNSRTPSFTYNTCGGFDVTLTVTDAVHPASTRTVQDFILADPQLLVQPSFTWAPGPVPNSIQFTDTSTGSPSVWSWDFDGDNVPDSAQQNPLWVYATGGSYNVSFTASNACGGSSTSGTVFVLANDDCATAIPLQLGLSSTYTNQNATTSQAWPCAAGGSDIWFSYTSTCTGTLEVNTCTGTNYDSSLEAFSGTCGALTPIVCNDDNCGLQSRISFPVQPATTYYIRVGGYNSAQGNFQLNLILASTGTGSFATQFPACGGANLATTGAPNLGAAIGFNMTPATGLSFFMIGSVPLGVPLCPQGCIIGHNMDVVLPGPTFNATVPCWPFLRGGQVYFQGLELGVAGGCPNGNPAQLVTTQTIVATIG
ncbi:MAG: PKD domain-containing protein [Planctomycetes bacterium]|nr:PKD domain-containing protein [Planctomycetota bacterium]